MNTKAVCLEENDRDNVVASNIKVVVQGSVCPSTDSPLTIGVNEPPLKLVVEAASMVMVVAASEVCVVGGEFHCSFSSCNLHNNHLLCG